MTHHHPSITSMPASPDAERHRRMLMYAITMGIRTVCIVLLLFVHGWWLLVVAIGAIVLPYIAVVIANVAPGRQRAPVERPGLLVPTNRHPGQTGDDPGTGDRGQDEGGNR